jgi:hypothetical protein
LLSLLPTAGFYSSRGELQERCRLYLSLSSRARVAGFEVSCQLEPRRKKMTRALGWRPRSAWLAILLSALVASLGILAGRIGIAQAPSRRAAPALTAPSAVSLPGNGYFEWNHEHAYHPTDNKQQECWYPGPGNSGRHHRECGPFRLIPLGMRGCQVHIVAGKKVCKCQHQLYIGYGSAAQQKLARDLQAMFKAARAERVPPGAASASSDDAVKGKQVVPCEHYGAGDSACVYGLNGEGMPHGIKCKYPDLPLCADYVCRGVAAGQPPNYYPKYYCCHEDARTAQRLKPRIDQRLQAYANELKAGGRRH